ncbi:MAG: septum formation initiator family protein [Bacteroidetes bacterium]|jgi:cell division protein FtsB|nr:septum formation initiator family protein [Bacteroidota bacterium]
MSIRWSRIQSLLPFLKNRYVLSVLVFGCWMLFFDQYNMQSQLSIARRMEQLEEEQQWYREQIALLRTEQQRLAHNPHELERIAREHYRMKRPNEDLFIVVETEE